MPESRIYLTLPIMLTAIEDVLSTEPYCCYQTLLLPDKFRTQLIASVFARIRMCYQVFIDDACVPCSSDLETESVLKEFVRQEMNTLIQENKLEHGSVDG